MENTLTGSQRPLLTEDCIRIWFCRMFSICKKCGSLLHYDNAYHRDDTCSRLHTYCKPCYIEIQKARNSQVVKNNNYFILINGKRLVTFDSLEEKRRYITERKSLAKFSKTCNEYSSRVGCSESYFNQNAMLCDQCGGLLAYDERGDLVCTVCNLIAEQLPVVLERSINFSNSYSKFSGKNSEQSGWFWMNQTADNEGSFDFYYSRAYSKQSKK